MYKICCYDENSRSIYPIVQFSAFTPPRVGEIIYAPHHGSYKVTKITYHISDDCDKFKNRILFVDIKMKYDAGSEL